MELIGIAAVFIVITIFFIRRGAQAKLKQKAAENEIKAARESSDIDRRVDGLTDDELDGMLDKYKR